MTTFIADDFASLGAALREIEAAKSPTMAADVPAESVKGYTHWGYTVPVVGTTFDPLDFMG